MPPLAGFSNILSRRTILNIFNGPQALAFLPALTLASFWIGGEGALLGLALLLPAVVALAGKKELASGAHPPAETNGLGQRARLEKALDNILQIARPNGRTTACMVVELDDYGMLLARLGHKAANDILRRTVDRLRGVLRDDDLIVRLDGAEFAIALAPVRRADLESLIQISARLQSAVSEPVSLDTTTVYVSCSIGFCLSTCAPDITGEAMLEAAEQALSNAKEDGPSTIRGYSPEMQHKAKAQNALIQDVTQALEDGHIIPWFQPQISTDTGEVSGFEALARWHHPERGMISPADFLPAIEQAGMFERLGEVILYHSLTCLKKWDKAGFHVPQVGVNFSDSELRNPKLVDKIRWELDRFDLSPDRLNVEILETVIAEADDDVITRNIAGLATLGCAIDLDDFGTGHASISNIRRFAVERIKIDRSFVTKVDTDPEQQRMVSAILTMAEQLNLKTLGEGVETAGEHAMLAQLGCTHVQGFGLGRPMPYADTLNWMQKHHEKLVETPKIGRGIG